MFYAEFVFPKSSPLHKIWIAAHLEKKLTRAQLLDVDLVRAIDEIVNSEVPLAMRMLGHLVFGIAKILHLRTSLVIDDIAGFRLRVEKVAPKQPRRAVRRTARRKEYAEVSFNAKVEDITLREESIPVMRILAETLEESRIQPFEDEVMRSFAGGLEETAFELSRISPQKNAAHAQQGGAAGFELQTSELPPLPDLSLPPEKSTLVADDAQVNFEAARRKFRVLKDVQTVIDKKSFKAQLADATAITKSGTLEPQERRIETLQLVTAPACGIISEKLRKLFKSALGDDRLRFERSENAAKKTAIEEVFEHAFDGGMESSLQQTRTRMSEMPKDLNATMAEISEFFTSRDVSTFCEFTAQCSRQHAVKRFVALLHLFKLDALSMDQPQPFHDITIHGTNFNSTLFHI